MTSRAMVLYTSHKLMQNIKLLAHGISAGNSNQTLMINNGYTSSTGKEQLIKQQYTIVTVVTLILIIIILTIILWPPKQTKKIKKK